MPSGLKTAAPRLIYRTRDGIYLNLTNRCPTACVFCVKRRWKWDYRGWNLKLASGEPSAEEVAQAAIAAMRERPAQEAVFCGYGEPTYRLFEILETSRRLGLEFPGLRLRLNTIGLGNLIWGRNIAGELASCLDAVSVSLNTADPAQWRLLHRPLPPYRERGFDAAVGFVRECVRAGLETTVTAIRQPGVDLAAVARLAESLGARFRERPAL